MVNILKVRGLTKSYEDHTVLDNVEFDPIMLNAVDSDANAILNIIGIPKEALKYFNITTDKSEYFLYLQGKGFI